MQTALCQLLFNVTGIIFKRPCHSLPPPYSTILPSSMRTIRSARRAMSSLWVIITTVCRNSALVRLISPSTSALVLLSRLPVGSSVNCTPIPLCLENRGFNCMHTCVLCTLSFYDKSKQVFFSRISHLLLYS